MAVTISGMFGSGHTYCADSPVVITINGLTWPGNSAFKVVRIEIVSGGAVVGDFRAETGGASSITFDISSALRAIWAGYDFAGEVAAAGSWNSFTRGFRRYSITVYTEYVADDGTYTTTNSGTFDGGQCLIGGRTEMERLTNGQGDASTWEHRNARNGDASTKPTSSPERVGADSITSWVDVSNSGTTSVFYSSHITPGDDSRSAHAPIVLRDTQAYTDFLFVNRRGAVETACAQTLEALSIEVNTQQYARVERPSFTPSRTITARATGGRRSWAMSSGAQTREWAEWWALEFLMARRHWMRYNGRFVPVTVEPAKKQTGIYDRAKQQMPSVDFTVTLALEG